VTYRPPTLNRQPVHVRSINAAAAASRSPPYAHSSALTKSASDRRNDCAKHTRFDGATHHHCPPLPTRLPSLPTILPFLRYRRVLSQNALCAALFSTVLTFPTKYYINSNITMYAPCPTPSITYQMTRRHRDRPTSSQLEKITSSTVL